jgi:hypothetical protein
LKKKLFKKKFDFLSAILVLTNSPVSTFEHSTDFDCDFGHLRFFIFLLFSGDLTPYTTFDQFVSQRRETAKRSLLVQVKSQESADDLMDYCSSNFGPIKSLHFHHNEQNEAFGSFFIVEFDEKDSVTEVVRSHAQHRFVSCTLNTVPEVGNDHIKYSNSLFWDF